MEAFIKSVKVRRSKKPFKQLNIVLLNVSSPQPPKLDGRQWWGHKAHSRCRHPHPSSTHMVYIKPSPHILYTLTFCGEHTWQTWHLHILWLIYTSRAKKMTGAKIGAFFCKITSRITTQNLKIGQQALFEEFAFWFLPIIKSVPRKGQNTPKSDFRGPKIPPTGASSTWNM